MRQAVRLLRTSRPHPPTTITRNVRPRLAATNMAAAPPLEMGSGTQRRKMQEVTLEVLEQYLEEGKCVMVMYYLPTSFSVDLLAELLHLLHHCLLLEEFLRDSALLQAQLRQLGIVRFDLHLERLDFAPRLIVVASQEGRQSRVVVS